MIRGTPYDDLDPMQRWSTTAAAIANDDIDAQGAVKFSIGSDERVASAGSCFAARIAERLRVDSANYLNAEPAPAWLPPDLAEKYGYVPFSARYGLVFTLLQLMQLFERAFGSFVPVENAWAVPGGFVDPFRPRISREPFASVKEVEADRAQHLGAVRRVFQTADVFVFTMGLTEVWTDARDGAAFPICPGLAGGTFDPQAHVFRNLTFAENYALAERFLAAIRSINPTLKIVLGVSPIPLGATIERQHVLRASTYSKSVLRAVAEEICRTDGAVDYFASYEMISQACLGHDAFLGDRRHLKTASVDRVVGIFLDRYFGPSRERSTRVIAPVPLLEAKACDEDVFAR